MTEVFRQLQDCIGTIDRYIDACVLDANKFAYIGHNRSSTWNIFAVCDFNMCLTFIIVCWKGSAHNSLLVKFIMRNTDYNFSKPPSGWWINNYPILDVAIHICTHLLIQVNIILSMLTSLCNEDFWSHTSKQSITFQTSNKIVRLLGGEMSTLKNTILPWEAL